MWFAVYCLRLAVYGLRLKVSVVSVPSLSSVRPSVGPSRRPSRRRPSRRRPSPSVLVVRPLPVHPVVRLLSVRLYLIYTPRGTDLVKGIIPRTTARESREEGLRADDARARGE